MCRPGPVPAKVDALAHRVYPRLGIQPHEQPGIHKLLHFTKYVPEVIFIIRKTHRIIHVADVMLHAQVVLHKMIQLVKVDIRKKLACQRSDREPYSIEPGAGNNGLRERQYVTIADSPPQYPHEDFMVYRGEALGNIRLQHMSWSRTSPKVAKHALLSGKIPLSFSAREGAIKKPSLEQRFNHADQRVMYYPVSEGRRVDHPLFWLKHLKTPPLAGNPLTPDQAILQDDKVLL